MSEHQAAQRDDRSRLHLFGQGVMVDALVGVEVGIGDLAVGSWSGDHTPTRYFQR